MKKIKKNNEIIQELYKGRVFSPNEKDSCPKYYKISIPRITEEIQIHDIVDGVLNNMKEAEVVIPYNEYRSYCNALEYIFRAYLKPGQKIHSFVGCMRYLQQVLSYEGYKVDLSIKDGEGNDIL